MNDTGWYSCEGFNHYGHQSTISYLLILPGTIHMSACVIRAALNNRIDWTLSRSVLRYIILISKLIRIYFKKLSAIHIGESPVNGTRYGNIFT